MAADPLEQMRADRERHRREEEADRPDWRHDTLDLDPVVWPTAGGHTVAGDVVRERTHGRALHAGRRVLRSAARSARSAPRRVPAGLVVGALLLGGAGVVSAVAAEGPLGWPSGVTAAPSTGSGAGSGADAQQPSVVVGDDGGSTTQQAAPRQGQEQPAAPQQGAARAAAPGASGQAAPGQGTPGSPARAAGPAGGPGSGPAAGQGAGPAGGPGAPRP